jgi:hypothetical protein
MPWRAIRLRWGTQPYVPYMEGAMQHVHDIRHFLQRSHH